MAVEVILLEQIKHLGVIGDKVKVKRGYARNFLIPYDKAVYATKANMDKFAIIKRDLELKAKKLYEQALQRKLQLDTMSEILISAKAGESGKLFGSVGARDIVMALGERGFAAVKSEVLIHDGAIRAVGDYEIGICLYSGVTATVTIKVSKEGSV
jgi:large subunit ribosomal protein L9